MAKKQYILVISDRARIARNKRLREAGVSVSVSNVRNNTTSTSGGGSGVDEKGIEDLAVVGTGNAFTEATLSSDKSLLTLRKGATFLDEATAVSLFLYRDRDDETPYKLTIGEVEVSTDELVKGLLTVEGNTILRKLLDVYGKITSHDDLQISDEFVTGLLGTGGHFSKGYGEMRGLTLWEWLEVPELRYNRVSINTGITWQTFGGGIIESVEITGENTGIITLKLEDGEIGTIAQDDLCMGIYHNYDGDNDEENMDTHNGNFHFTGFQTVYFRVETILDTDTNGRFTYVLRDYTGGGGDWQDHNHPSAYMHFAAYANPSNTERQECIYSTTTYLIALYHMTDWEYGQSNIYYIRGILDGFTVGDKELNGTGIYIGNGYFSGAIEQITNAPYEMEITIVDADNLVDEGEGRTIECKVVRFYTEQDVAAWKVTRETSDSEADAEWNAAHTDFDGTLVMTFDEIFGDADSALFRFTATMADGTEVTDSIILHAFWIDDPEYRMDIDTQGDMFIGYGDTEPFKVWCYVYKGWNNKTDEVKEWGVSRDSGDEAEDKAWDNDHSDFAGYIELTWDDLGTNYTQQAVVFTFTASDGHNTAKASLDFH